MKYIVLVVLFPLIINALKLPQQFDYSLNNCEFLKCNITGKKNSPNNSKYNCRIVTSNSTCNMVNASQTSTNQESTSTPPNGYENSTANITNPTMMSSNSTTTLTTHKPTEINKDAYIIVLYSLYGAVGLNVLQLSILLIIAIRTGCNCFHKSKLAETQSNNDNVELTQLATTNYSTVDECNNASTSISDNLGTEICDDTKASEPVPQNTDKKKRPLRRLSENIMEHQTRAHKNQRPQHRQVRKDYRKLSDGLQSSFLSSVSSCDTSTSPVIKHSNSSFNSPGSHKQSQTPDNDESKKILKTTKNSPSNTPERRHDVFWNESSKPLAPSDLPKLCKIMNSKGCSTLPSRFKTLQRGLIPKPPTVISLKPSLKKSGNEHQYQERKPQPMPADNLTENHYERVPNDETENEYMPMSSPLDFNAKQSVSPTYSLNRNDSTTALVDNVSSRAAVTSPLSKKKPVPLQRAKNLTKSQPNLLESFSFNI
ncbi:hypothetical protein CHUAL_003626 [Chamberlinius hualienensis]